MDAQKKQQKIYESINEFFLRAIELKETGKISKFFRFLKKAPDHAPFNNALVFRQNPDCSYYATANQWYTRFGRTIKADARPMVILFPFGPVDFVYDIESTEGEPITDEKLVFWWRENGGYLDNSVFENTLINLEKINVDFKKIKAETYFNEVDFGTGGFAQRDYLNDELRIVLHPRYEKPTIEAYGVLCHEIAHILLGHLGSICTKPKEKLGEWITGKEIVRDRPRLSQNVKEVEAELVAWIVFNSFGIEKNSEGYIATWLTGENIVPEISMSDILKVAGEIQDMGKRKDVFK